MKVIRKAGATSNIFQIFIADSSSTTGAGLAALTNASSGLTAYYHRDTDTTATAISLVTMTVGTFTSSGFKEIDATNMPGWYQFCPPDAAIAASAKSCGFHLKGATNMAPLPIEVQLVAYDPDDAVRFGLTALPNAAAEASGGLFTRGAGAGQINQPANGMIDGNVVRWLGTAASTPTTAGVPNVNVKTWNDLTTVALPLVPTTAGRTLVVDAAGLADANTVKLGPTGTGTAQTARDIGASVLLSTGTGTGQLDFTSGVVKANLAQILGTALTETAGLLAGGFKKFFNVAAPTLTCLGIDQTGDSYARIGAPVGASISADVAGVQADTDNIQTRLPTSLVSGRIDASVGAVAANAITAAAIADGAIDRATFAADTGLQTIRSNTAQAGAAGTVTLDASASVTDSFYNGTAIILTGGTGVGQARLIVSYVGSTKVATISPSWGTNPDNTSTFAVMPTARISVGAWQEAVVNVLISGRVDGTVGSYQSGQVPLQPTIAGRTLDVSAGGEAGLDWANIGSPTTTVGLSGTTVGTITTYTGDTPQTGDTFARVGAAGAGLTALGDSRIANLDATVTSRTKPADTQAAVTTVTNLTNAPTSGDFTATMKTSLNAATPAVTVSDKTGFSLAALDAPALENGTAQAGAASTVTLRSGASATDSLYRGQEIEIYGGTGVGQARIITAYVGSTKVATVDEAWTTQPDNTSTYRVKHRSPKLDSSQRTTDVNSANLDTTVSSRTKPADTQAAVTTVTNLTNAPGAGDFTATMKTSLNAATPVVTVSDKTGFSLSAGGIQAIWDALTSALTTVGSIGKLLVDNINATISSRLATSGYTVPPTVGAIADQVWDETLADHLTVGSTGSALNSAGSAGDPWGTALPGAYGAGTAGKIIGDNVDAKISTRSTFAGGAVASVTGNVGGNVVGSVASVTAGVTVTTNNDKTGYALTSSYDPAKTASQAGDAMALTSGERTTLTAAIWNALTSGMTTVGSIGKKLADWVVGTAQTGDSYARLGAPVGASVSADIAAIQADTDNLQTRLPAALVSGRMDSSVGAYPGNTAQTGDAFARLGAPAGASVSIDVAAVKSDTAAVKAKTDNLPAAPAAVGDIPTATQNADALLDRSAGVETGITPRQALRLGLAADAGKLSGAATATIKIRDRADTKDRITATVDADGNRTAVTVDVS